MSRRTAVLCLFAAAIFCFVVATLIAVNDVIHGGNYDAWVAGGLVAVAAALTAERAQ